MSEASSTNRTSCRRLSGDRFRMEWTERRRTDLRQQLYYKYTIQ